MQIAEVTWRHRNDFHWVGKCRWCGTEAKYGDGYADAFYCHRVAPERHCPKCGLNCLGAKAEKFAASAVSEASLSQSAPPQTAEA